MISVMWRGASADFDAVGFSAQFPLLKFDETWRRGDPRAPHGVHNDAGFKKHVGDFEKHTAAIKIVRNLLDDWKDALLLLQNMGVASSIDFGVFVGDHTSYMATVSFTPELLHVLGALGVGIEVASYPVDDDDDDDDDDD